MAKIEVEKRETVGAKGVSDNATLEAMFPASPALPGGYMGQYNNVRVAEIMATLTGEGLPNGIQDQNPDYQVSLNYGDAPNLAAVATGGQGLPGSPYVPAPGSPGAGSTNPRDIPDPPQNFPRTGPTGNGSTKSPHESSQQISTQSEGGGVTPGNLIPGGSGATP